MDWGLGLDKAAKMKTKDQKADPERQESIKTLKIAMFGDAHLGEGIDNGFMSELIADARKSSVGLDSEGVRAFLKGFESAERRTDVSGAVRRYEDWLRKHGAREERMSEDQVLRQLRDLGSVELVGDNHWPKKAK